MVTENNKKRGWETQEEEDIRNKKHYPKRYSTSSSIKTSNFLVTINTNKTTDSALNEFTSFHNFGITDRETAEYAKNTLLHSLSKTFEGALRNKRNYKPRLDIFLQYEDITDIIISKTVFEVGDAQKRLHIHSKVTVIYPSSTTGYFHVNIPSLINEIKRNLPEIEWGNGPFINVEFIRTEENLAEKYAYKNINTPVEFERVNVFS